MYKADIWSLGILLHVLLTGFWPYSANSDSIRDKKVRAGDISLLRNDLPGDPNLFVLFNGMFNKNYHQRFSIEDVINCSWLEERTLESNHNSCPQFFSNVNYYYYDEEDEEHSLNVQKEEPKSTTKSAEIQIPLRANGRHKAKRGSNTVYPTPTVKSSDKKKRRLSFITKFFARPVSQ